MFAIGLALLTSGCAAVLEAAAANPAALVFLPVAAAAEVIGRIAKEDRKPATGMVSISAPTQVNAPLAYRYWEDSADWVAECAGPMMCGGFERFWCTGTPGDCYCDCVGSLIARTD